MLMKGQIRTLKNSQKITWDMSLTNHHVKNKRGKPKMDDNTIKCFFFLKGKRKERGGPSGKNIHEN